MKHRNKKVTWLFNFLKRWNISDPIKHALNTNNLTHSGRKKKWDNLWKELYSCRSRPKYIKKARCGKLTLLLHHIHRGFQFPGYQSGIFHKHWILSQELSVPGSCFLLVHTEEKQSWTNIAKSDNRCIKYMYALKPLEQQLILRLALKQITCAILKSRVIRLKT